MKNTRRIFWEGPRTPPRAAFKHCPKTTPRPPQDAHCVACLCAVLCFTCGMWRVLCMLCVLCVCVSPVLCVVCVCAWVVCCVLFVCVSRFGSHADWSLHLPDPHALTHSAVSKTGIHLSPLFIATHWGKQISGPSDGHNEFKNVSSANPADKPQA